MKRAASFLALAAILSSCSGSKAEQKTDPAPVTPAPAAEPAPAPEPVVITQPNADSPVVAVRLVFKGGSVEDPADQAGVTSLMADLMAEGTQQLDAAALKAALFPYATDIISYVEAETTVFKMTVHREVADRALPVLFDVITTPRMDPRDFERLRHDAIVDIQTRLRQADDENLGKAALAHFLWNDHPYGRNVGGTVQALQKLTLEQVQAQRAKLITQARLVAGIGGGYSPQTLQLFKDAIARIPRGTNAQPAALPELPPVDGIRVHIIQKDTDSTPITMGFRYGLTRSHPDFMALMVANSAFGEHRQMGGRLFYRMREVRGLNYGDYSYLEHFVQEGWDTLALLNIPRRQHAFTLWVRPVEPDDRAFALRQALYELRRLTESGLTEEEFERTRSFLLGYTLLWEQGASRSLGYALDDAINGTPEFLPSLRKKLETLTLQEVNDAIKRHLQADRMEVSILARDADALRTLLLSGAPTPRPAEKTKNLEPHWRSEDEVISGYDLKLAPERVDVTPVEQLFEQ